MWASYTAWCRRYPWFLLAACVVPFILLFGICIVVISIPESDVDFAPFTKSEIVSARAFCEIEVIYDLDPLDLLYYGSDSQNTLRVNLERAWESEVDSGTSTLQDIYSETEAECGRGATQRISSYFED